MNIEPPKQNVPQNENQPSKINTSNVISGIIAFLAIALIFFAIYLLSQTFNKPNASDSKNSIVTTVINGSSSSSAIQSTNNSSLRTSSTTASSFNYLDTLKNSSSSNNSNSSSNSSNSTSSNASNSSSNGSSSQSTSEGSQTVDEGEILVRYSSANQSFTILSCNIPSPYLCKSGTVLKYSIPSTAVDGDTFLMTGGTIIDEPKTLNLSGFRFIKRG